MNLEFNVLDYAIIEGRHNSLVNATYLLVQSKFYLITCGRGFISNLTKNTLF